MKGASADLVTRNIIAESTGKKVSLTGQDPADTDNALDSVIATKTSVTKDEVYPVETLPPESVVIQEVKMGDPEDEHMVEGDEDNVIY